MKKQPKPPVIREECSAVFQSKRKFPGVMLWLQDAGPSLARVCCTDDMGTTLWISPPFPTKKRAKAKRGGK